MLYQSMVIDQLLAHSLMYEEAAQMYSDKPFADDLERLAEDCREAALAIINEMRLLFH
jgi:hypothetical protein